MWEPMWNRHEHASLTHWDSVIHELQQVIPVPAKPIEWRPITVDEWVTAVRHRRPASATGPDGVAREDLLNLPYDLQQAIVRIVNELEQGHRAWPSTALVGLITSLEKHEKASSPGHFRPICVLSQIYRTYTSIRSKQILMILDGLAPPTMAGNRPGMTTKHVWYKIAQFVERSHIHGTGLGGLATDVVKCFNNLPRLVIAFIARHLTIPEAFVRNWHQALAKIERRFLIAGCCSDAVYSCTGYPEGDGMSVVAMSLLNFGLHYLVESSLQASEVYTYVDNWELVTTAPQELPNAFRQLQQFAAKVDLELDVKKSFGWALRSSDRALLREHDLPVVYDARDLGGHVVYCKRKTMGTLRARISGGMSSWTWLARSVAPLQHKLQMLQVVMWPRMLHGISGLWIGPEHTKRLRAAAMQSLGWKRKGASSVLQFGLGENPMADPGYYSLATTISDFRRYCDPHVDFPVVTAIAHGVYPRYTAGPIGAFVHRLHELHWHWEDNGFLVDHHGNRFHLIDSPIQLLSARMQEAWALIVGSAVCDRSSFAGLENVDLTLSHCGVPDRPMINLDCCELQETEPSSLVMHKCTPPKHPIRNVHTVGRQTVWLTDIGIARSLQTFAMPSLLICDRA